MEQAACKGEPAHIFFPELGSSTTLRTSFARLTPSARSFWSTPSAIESFEVFGVTLPKVNGSDYGAGATAAPR